MKTTKTQKNQLNEYLLNSIINEQGENIKDLNYVYACFKSEFLYPSNLNYYGSIENCFKNWLQGLPSCLNIDFTYHDIIKRGKELNLINEQATDEQENKLCRIWFKLLTNTFFGLYAGRKYELITL